jgi:hypothetical protein
VPGGKQIALSHADIAQSNDVFAIFSNPGGLVQIDSIELGIYYSPAPFGMEELQTAYLGCTVPFSFGCAGLGIMHYGFPLYNVSEIHLAFGGKYGLKIDYGLALNLHQVKIENYGSDIALQADAGLICALSQDFSWGVALRNATQSTIGRNHEVLPSVYTTGVAWNPIQKGYIFLSLEKETGYSPSIHVGYSFTPIKYLILLSGYSTNPAIISAGISLKYKNTEFDYAVTHHNDLGYSHQISLILSINGLGL